MSDGGHDEVTRVRALVRLAREEHLLQLRVGDLVIVPGPVPRANPQAEQVRAEVTSADAELKALRELSAQQFGRVLSDAQLRAMKGAL